MLNSCSYAWDSFGTTTGSSRQYTHWIYDLTHVWLLYYYVSLALRENILAVNGSDIRPW